MLDECKQHAQTQSNDQNKTNRMQIQQIATNSKERRCNQLQIKNMSSQNLERLL